MNDNFDLKSSIEVISDFILYLSNFEQKVLNNFGRRLAVAINTHKVWLC